MFISRKRIKYLTDEIEALKSQLAAIDQWIGFQVAEKQQALTEQQSGHTIYVKDSSGRPMGKGRKE